MVTIINRVTAKMLREMGAEDPYNGQTVTSYDDSADLEGAKQFLEDNGEAIHKAVLSLNRRRLVD